MSCLHRLKGRPCVTLISLERILRQSAQRQQFNAEHQTRRQIILVFLLELRDRLTRIANLGVDLPATLSGLVLTFGAPLPTTTRADQPLVLPETLSQQVVNLTELTPRQLQITRRRDLVNLNRRLDRG